MTDHGVRTPEQLLALYGPVPERAAGKVHATLDDHDRAFVARAPFLLLATSAAGGLLDVSPRGDRPGFVHVTADGDLVLPDRPGNNRVDSMLNVLSDPRVAMLLLVPGLTHTLRVNGTGAVTTDPDVLALGGVNGRLPRTALVVRPVEVMYQCGRAVQRSGLWDPAAAPDDLPTLDVVLADQVPGLTLERSLAYGAQRDPLW